MPSIALTRRDRDFLFNQLRSTTAVLDYLCRAAKEPAIPHGEERVRYYELAATDADAPPDCLALGGRRTAGAPRATLSSPEAPTALPESFWAEPAESVGFREY